MNSLNKTAIVLAVVSVLAVTGACLSTDPEGLAPAPEAETTVMFDFFKRPLPEIPLPNDIATRYDATSATGLRINASMIAPTGYEKITRELIDRLDGWGTFPHIAIPFTGPLDVESILAGHRDVNYDPSDDVVYVINIDRDSDDFGTIHATDMGNGNYPVILERLDKYGKNDPRGESINLLFEESNEDLNGNGALDPGEDSDADGLLDTPNYLPGMNPEWDDLAGRADAIMTFYEKQTNTLLVRTMEPLNERTTYAVLVTRRVLDINGNPVGSPFEFINHAAQTEALSPLADVLPDGLGMSDIAFAFTFTTQTTDSAMVAVRDGLYGHGIQGHIGEEFPAEITSLAQMRDEDEFPDTDLPHLLYGENWAELFPSLATAFLGWEDGQEQSQFKLDQAQYVDYIVGGSFESPQLFRRNDEQGNFLEYNRQSWPEDLDSRPAEARSETVYFTLIMPRKEISARGRGEPVPLVIIGHGYTGNRFSTLTVGMNFVRHGYAVIGIDGPSHGISISPEEVEQASNIFKAFGLEAFANFLLTDRAFDQNNDGETDTGADFWTSHVFHTRDMVRQFALDYMQLIRIIRAFDGERRWSLDVNGDGEPELAGDFDADGAIDIGADSNLHMIGASLGGMMSMIMGGLDPEFTSVMPVAGGGGLADAGFRSQQGGVPDAFFIAGVLGPIYAGTLIDDEMVVETVVADLNRTRTVRVGSVSGAAVGDLMVVENLANGERGCGFVLENGTVRASVESDKGDPTRIHLYRGAEVIAGTKCEFSGSDTPVAVVDSFHQGLSFQGEEFAAESQLVSLGHGLGRRRSHPDLRKVQALGQLVLDPGDPLTFAPHLFRKPLYFPGTDQSTGTHALVVSTVGDMSVPVSTGITYARAAGLIDYKNDDPRYGKPVNQVLIDTYTAEAVNTLGRFVTPAGERVHMDVEVFSGGDDLMGSDVERLDQPLRLGFGETDPLGGASAAIFPISNPQGEHGFADPGENNDRARRECLDACEEVGEDPCGCQSASTFDIGHFMYGFMSKYILSDGTVLDADLCSARNDCAEFQAPPAARDVSSLP